jgi:hypothetical protein
MFKFNLLQCGGEVGGGTHIVDEHNWPIAVSVELSSQCVLEPAVHLHLGFRSVRNTLV